MKIIDCSHLIHEQSMVYPDDPKVKIQSIAYYAKDGYALSHVSLSMHTATHIDAPCHLSDNPKQANDFLNELMMQDVVIVDVSNQEVITLSQSQLDYIEGHSVVFLYTGWSMYYDTEAYFHHPTLSRQSAEALIQKGVKVIGVDMPSIDEFPYPIHECVLSHEVWIVENVKLTKEMLTYDTLKVVIAPIKIEAEAALARVFLLVNQT